LAWGPHKANLGVGRLHLNHDYKMKYSIKYSTKLLKFYKIMHKSKQKSICFAYFHSLLF
jgi:hypothetical protein